MKKILILIAALSMFASCSVEVAHRDDPQTVSISGTLMMERGADGSESLFLVDSDGRKSPLTSLAIDLSKPEYVGNTVDLSGFYKESNSVFEVTGIAVLAVNKSENKPGVLTTFVSDQNGFEISYYDDWEINEIGDEVEFVFSEGDAVVARVSVEKRPFIYMDDELIDAKVALEEFLKDDKSAQGGKWVVVGADGYDAFNESDSYYFYRHGFVYNVSFADVDRENVSIDDLRREFLTMLGTFKFVAFGSDEESIALGDDDMDFASLYDGEMATFESLLYSFKGLYPKSWYYAGSKVYELGVLHHYAFSDETVDDDNVKISLDVLSTPLPKGEKLNYGGRDYVVITNDDVVEYYFLFEGKTFRIGGSSDFNDLILAIAGSIEKLDLQNGN